MPVTAGLQVRAGPGRMVGHAPRACRTCERRSRCCFRRVGRDVPFPGCRSPRWPDMDAGGGRFARAVPLLPFCGVVHVKGRLVRWSAVAGAVAVMVAAVLMGGVYAYASHVRDGDRFVAVAPEGATVDVAGVNTGDLVVAEPAVSYEAGSTVVVTPRRGVDSPSVGTVLSGGGGRYDVAVGEAELIVKDAHVVGVLVSHVPAVGAVASFGAGLLVAGSALLLWRTVRPTGPGGGAA